MVERARTAGEPLVNRRSGRDLRQISALFVGIEWRRELAVDALACQRGGRLSRASTFRTDHSTAGQPPQVSAQGTASSAAAAVFTGRALPWQLVSVVLTGAGW